jgi:ribonuclease R
VELIESMTFGFVPASSLSDDHYNLSNDGSTLVGRKTKKHFELNGRLDVVVDRVDRFKRLIDFTVA